MSTKTTVTERQAGKQAGNGATNAWTDVESRKEGGEGGPSSERRCVASNLRNSAVVSLLARKFLSLFSSKNVNRVRAPARAS